MEISKIIIKTEEYQEYQDDNTSEWINSHEIIPKKAQEIHNLKASINVFENNITSFSEK